MTSANEKFQFVKIDEFASEHISAPHYSYWKSVFKQFFKSKLAIGMLIFSAAVIAGIITYEKLGISPVYQLALVVFVAAWIGQFAGHKIEGKKPSFFQDIQFLLIGPIWLLGFLYRKLGIPY